MLDHQSYQRHYHCNVKFKSRVRLRSTFNMQKFVLLAVVGLCLAAYTTANDLDLGERQDGDVLAASRRLLRPVVPGKSMIAKSGFNTEGIITAISAKNADGQDATITIMKGGVGTSSVVVSAVGELGAGLDVQLDIYAL